MKKTARMRSLIESPKVCVSPGVYDGYSVRVVEAAGFEAASTTGAGIANSRLGQPDIGIMSMLENVEACRQMANSVDIPLMADADTGYGNAVTTYHTVQQFEDAGVVGINLEDQAIPKRCGHMQGKEIISAAEMAKKVEAAVAARHDDDFIINARTDAIAIEGLDKAIERAKLYAKAGADMIFPDAIPDEEAVRRFVGEVGIPITVNIGFGIRSRPTTPLMSLKRLEELGVARISVPRMLPAASIKAMSRVLMLLRQCAETGETMDRPDLLASIEDITSLMDYDRINALEKAYLLPEQLSVKYD